MLLYVVSVLLQILQSKLTSALCYLIYWIISLLQKLPKGKCEFCDSGCGLYANGEEIVPVIVNDEGNIAIKTACFVEFLLSFDNQEEDFSIDNVIEMCKVDITDFVKRHPENFPLDLYYTEVSFGRG